MSFCNYQTIGQMKITDKQLKKNKVFVMNNILKICFSAAESIYILTNDKSISGATSLDLIDIKKYEFVGGNASGAALREAASPHPGAVAAVF